MKLLLRLGRAKRAGGIFRAERGKFLEKWSRDQ